MSRVLTLGEMLMRLEPSGGLPLSQASGFNRYFGGAEANVAISLSRLGHDVSYFTALPESHPISEAMLMHLHRAGVTTNEILRKGERIGTYYLEPGVSLRPANVIYDRANTSVLSLAEEKINWESLFKNYDWLHITGITSALAEDMHKMVMEAVQQAQLLNVKVSFDFNFRSKLWSKEEARAAFKEILPYVDHCFAGWKDFAWLFNWTPEGEDYDQQLEFFYKKLMKDYRINSAASTHREIFGSQNHKLTGYFFQDGVLYAGEGVNFDVIDRVGGGDSFAAGILHGIMSGMSVIDMIPFATYYSILTHLVKGDQSDYTSEDVYNLITNHSGDVDR